MPVTEEQRAAMSIARGKIASGIKDPKKRRDFISRQGDQEAIRSEHFPELAEETHRERNRQEAEKVLDSMQMGGMVPKTGPYRVHAGETVLPAGAPLMNTAVPPMGAGRRNPMLGMMEKGGKVEKTGVYKLHKDEQVVPKEEHSDSHSEQAHPAGEPRSDSHVQELRKKQLGSNGMQGN